MRRSCCTGPRLLSKAARSALAANESVLLIERLNRAKPMGACLDRKKVIPCHSHTHVIPSKLRRSSTTALKRRVQWEEQGMDHADFERPNRLSGPPKLPRDEERQDAPTKPPVKVPKQHVAVAKSMPKPQEGKNADEGFGVQTIYLFEFLHLSLNYKAILIGIKVPC